MLKYFVLIASLSLLASSAFAEDEDGDITTRFGALQINDENVLLYKNKPLNPLIQGNSSLQEVGTYQLGKDDVVLIQNNGGSACPVQLYFVTVSASGAKATPSFGTCTDYFVVKKMADSIKVTMPAWIGLMAPYDLQRKVDKEKHHVFLFKAGVMTENGGPLRSSLPP
ncbi:hypothetical protein [Collimonas sp.]|jgi:hypothetical protein|uniref:hypothetical protein n=1 Tax=Collimonas sp. TaxID=1963772 RepID=UPI002C8A69DE|nr:hypothetical protein [Collimonas sp.]HWW99887.1 hypothetical protein [Collimonas sp.]